MCSRERNCICDSGVVGNARPCQGRDRGFEPRLSLYSKRDIQMDVSFLNEPHPGLEVRASTLRFGRRKAEVHRTSCAVYRSNNEKDIWKESIVWVNKKSDMGATKSAHTVSKHMREKYVPWIAGLWKFNYINYKKGARKSENNGWQINESLIL